MASQTTFRFPRTPAETKPRGSAFAARLGTALLAPLLLSLSTLLSGCGVAATGGPAASPIAKEQAALATGTIPATFFGLVVKDAAGAAPSVPSGARRLWDSGVTWAALEPTPGAFQWSTLDSEIAQAEQSGAAITLTLGMTPAWASSEPLLPSSYGLGATALPARLADWDSYVAAVAARYRGRISAYELWNAPEDSTYWSASASTLGSDLALLAAHAAAGIHAADPAAMLVSPALSPSGLQQFLAAGGGASIDVLGAALTLPGQTPEAGIATLQALRAAAIGTPADAKPIWNNSGAWLFPTATLPQSGLDAQLEAAYTARTLILNAAFAVTRMHWYAWDDRTPQSITLTNAAHQPKPSAQAYAQVQTWLAGARLNGCTANPGGLWTCQLTQSGHTQYILWSTAGPVTASNLGTATATALDGTPIPLNPDGSLPVGASPTLLQ